MAAILEVESTLTDRFLGFLSHDMANHPEQLQPVGTRLAQRIQSLVGGLEVDLDAALSADDE